MSNGHKRIRHAYPPTMQSQPILLQFSQAPRPHYMGNKNTQLAQPNYHQAHIPHWLHLPRPTHRRHTRQTTPRRQTKLETTTSQGHRQSADRPSPPCRHRTSQTPQGPHTKINAHTPHMVRVHKAERTSNTSSHNTKH